MALLCQRVFRAVIFLICSLLITHVILWFVVHKGINKSKNVKTKLESQLEFKSYDVTRNRDDNNNKHHTVHDQNNRLYKNKNNQKHGVEKVTYFMHKQHKLKDSHSFKFLSAKKNLKRRKSYRHFIDRQEKIQNEEQDHIIKFLSKNKLKSLIEDNIPLVHTSHVDCKSLSEGDPVQLKKAMQYQLKHYKVQRYTTELSQLASNCSDFITYRHYTMVPLSKEEAGFPIAFSILVYKDVDQVERLLRAIYRPQNYYCIHIDKKANRDLWQAMHAIVACFDNVFISPESIDVEWGTYSVLEPELICMELLWKYKWKYFINLTGQEFPLQTNSDIVKILKTFNGANNVEGTAKRINVERLRYVHNGTQPNYNLPKAPATFDIRFTKGSVHAVLQRGFVDYVLHNENGLAFREWVKDTGFPEETFFSSLNYSPQLNIPGSYKGEPETDKIDDGARTPRNPFIARFKNWGMWPFNWKCAGMRIRNVCIFGVGDLPLLVKRKELFANKFLPDYQPLVYDCLEEIHYNRIREQVLGVRKLDTTFYRNLDLVKNHVT